MHYVVHHQADRHDELWGDRSIHGPAAIGAAAQQATKSSTSTSTNRTKTRVSLGHTIVSSNNTKSRELLTTIETDAAASITSIIIINSSGRLAGRQEQEAVRKLHTTLVDTSACFCLALNKTEVQLPYISYRQSDQALLSHSPMTVIAFTWSPQWCTKPRSSMSIMACGRHSRDNTNPRRT